MAAPIFRFLRRTIENPELVLHDFGLDGTSLRHDLRGGRHLVSYMLGMLRGNRVDRRAILDQVTPEKPPILLIHGYLGTRGSLYMLESRLRQDGFCVFSFNLGTFNTRDIRRSAFLIHRKIENILTQSPVKKLDILGFSMGGLIGLYYVKKLGGSERVRKLVLLGSPVRGTWAALAGVWLIGLRSSSAWQLLPGSDFLAELGEGSLPPSVTYYSIAALRDWLCPVRSTVLDGGYSVSVPYGHSSLVFSEDVYRHIRWALAHRPAAPGATVPLDWALAEG